MTGKNPIPPTLPRDPAERLQSCGCAMYGARWQTAMANHFDIDRTTVRRWMEDNPPPPAELDAMLAKACRERANELGRDVVALEKLAKYLEDGR